MLGHTQGRFPSVSGVSGIILKDVCSLCPAALLLWGLEQKRESWESQTPSKLLWMNHEMLQSLLLFMQGSLKE